MSIYWVISMYKKIVTLVILVISGSFGAGCFFPEQFFVELCIDEDGSYVSTYKGTLVSILIAEEILSKNGVLTSNENEYVAMYLNEFNRPGFDNVEYLGQGRFYVEYVETGSFAGKTRGAFTHMPRLLSITDTGTDIRINCEKLDDGQILAMNRLGVKYDGILLIKSELETQSHNADSGSGISVVSPYKWSLGPNHNTAKYCILSPKSLTKRYLKSSLWLLMPMACTILWIFLWFKKRQRMGHRRRVNKAEKNPYTE